ncbi:hypothetical protein Peur_068719 [Populus x canadensis]
MARGLGMAFLAAIAVAALIHGSAAQSTHTVGDTTGWAIPPSSAFYSTWAASQNFSVDDILVFNFAPNTHDVAKVTKADYDACNTTSPISLEANPPVRITINASGEHYFLCNFPGHCSGGQKLMINVSAASSSPSPSPAPQPSTPAPQPSTPAPQPSTPTPQSSPAPQPSTPTPASSPSPPTPASSPSPPPTTPPSSSPPSPPTTTPPTTPPPNSATSLGLAGFTTFLSIFVALCY